MKFLSKLAAPLIKIAFILSAFFLGILVFTGYNQATDQQQELLTKYEANALKIKKMTKSIEEASKSKEQVIHKKDELKHMIETYKSMNIKNIQNEEGTDSFKIEGVIADRESFKQDMTNLTKTIFVSNIEVSDNSFVMTVHLNKGATI